METFALGQELINNSAIPASVFAASVGGRSWAVVGVVGRAAKNTHRPPLIH